MKRLISKTKTRDAAHVGPKPPRRAASDSVHTFRLDSKTAVVTGGMGRIGGAIVRALLDAGARVVIIDCQDDTGRGARRPAKSPALFERADLSKPKAIPEIVAGLDRRLGGFDVWINCAYPRTKDWGVPPERDRPESWQRNVEMQMVAVCLAADHAAQCMARRKGGSIINTASIYGMVGPDFAIYRGTKMTTPAAYSAIKGGVVAHTRYLASYYGRAGVRANVLCPGGVAAGQPGSFVAAYSRRTALGRMAVAAELGPPAVFLASSASSYVTGAVLMVDGGWTAI